jgi:hypothetical protein
MDHALPVAVPAVVFAPNFNQESELRRRILETPVSFAPVH